jgi:hypothetical protein
MAVESFSHAVVKDLLRSKTWDDFETIAREWVEAIRDGEAKACDWAAQMAADFEVAYLGIVSGDGSTFIADCVRLALKRVNWTACAQMLTEHFSESHPLGAVGKPFALPTFSKN